MKLSPAQAHAFLQNPDSALRVVLVYGPDAGLVRERAEAVAKRIAPDPGDPFRVIILSSGTIAEDPARLGDEMAAQALGGGRRLVRVTHATEAIAGAIASLLSGMPEGDSFLLLEAGELEKRSKLRQLCEGDGKTIGALACYAEEGPARQRIIAEMLEHLGTRASRNVLAFLGDILPPDRMAMRSEIEKLALYARGKPGIEMEDVLAVVHDAGAAEIDDLVYAAGAGNGMQVRQLLDRLFAEQVSAVAILRAAQRHFLRLQWARDQMEKGVGAAEAVKKLQPPVFWKHVEPMCAQVRRWPLMHIERILETLYEAEAAVKRTGASEAVQLSHILLGVTAGLVRRPNAAA